MNPQESIKKTIECLGYSVADINYMCKHGYYKSEDGSFEFPFFFEVAIVNTTNLRRNLLHKKGLIHHPSIATSSYKDPRTHLFGKLGIRKKVARVFLKCLRDTDIPTTMKNVKNLDV